MAVAVIAFVATSAPGATITGKVTDAQLGTPLPAMIVAAYNPSGQLQASATSDLTGRYSLPMNGGSYRLLAYDATGLYATMFNGDASSFDTTQVTTVASELSNINFALKRAGYIAGTVTTTGPSAGIIVAAYNLDGSRRGFTNAGALGAYTLALPPGSYKVAAYDANGIYTPSFFADQTSFASATVLSVTALLTSAASFHLDAAAHLTGTVVDEETAQPIAGVTAAAFDGQGNDVADATTNASGAYDIRLPPGTYRLGAFDLHNQYVTCFLGNLRFSDSPLLSLSAGETRPNLVLTMWRGAAVTGKVTDVSGNAIPATVDFYAADGTLRQRLVASSTGSFSILIPPGDYRVAAYDEAFNYVPQFYSLAATFAEATPVRLSSGQILSTPLLFTLNRGSRISGTVTDSATGAPVSGITVAAYNLSGDLVTHTTTTSAGTYNLMLLAGNYRIVAWDDSFRYATVFAGGSSFETASSVGAAAAALDIRITKGVHISGGVRDTAGNWLSGISVSALDSSGNHVGTATTFNGTFDLALLPGSYRLVAVDPLSRFPTTSMPSPLLVTSSGVTDSIIITLSGGRARRRAVTH